MAAVQQLAVIEFKLRVHANVGFNNQNSSNFEQQNNCIYQLGLMISHHPLSTEFVDNYITHF